MAPPLLLDVLPLWAAVECGATRAIAVDVLPEMPSKIVRGAARLAASVSPRRRATGGMEVFKIGRNLGSLADAVRWKPGNARSWIEMGEEDAAEVARRLASERVLPLK